MATFKFQIGELVLVGTKKMLVKEQREFKQYAWDLPVYSYKLENGVWYNDMYLSKTDQNKNLIFEEVSICAHCDSDEIGEKHSGDEGWTVCDACGMIEGGYKHLFRCPHCETLCENEVCDCKEIEMLKELATKF